MGHKLNRTDYTHLIKLLKEGSYDLCCTFVEEKQVIPIASVQSISYLTHCVQNPRDENATKHFSKFIKYLSIGDAEKQKDMKNYLLSVYYIFKILIIKERWDCMQSLIYLIKLSDADELNTENIKWYTMIRKQILTSFCNQKTKTTTNEEHIKAFLSVFIKYEAEHNIKGLLLFLQQEAVRFTETEFSTQFGLLAVDAITSHDCEIFKNWNFIIIFDILRKCFIHHEVTKSIKNAELCECIDKLHSYAMKTLKDKSLLEVMKYFVSTKEFYISVDQRNLQEPEMFLQPIGSISKAYSSLNTSTVMHLQEVVTFCVSIFGSLRTTDRELIHKVKAIKYTKDLDKSLTVFISHAKSQAIVLESAKMVKKCCCSIDRHLSNAIRAQTFALEFVTMLLRKVEEPKDISTEICMSLHKLVTKILESLECLQKAGCKNLTSQWEYLYQIVVNFCFSLVKAKRQNVNVLFLETLVKSAFKYDAQCLHKNETNTIHTFYYLADCLVAFKRWQDAMDICVLAFKLFRNNPALTPLVLIWNTAMYNSKMSATWCDVWEGKSEYLQSLCGKLEKLDKLQTVEMLKAEVTNYVRRYKNWKQVDRCLDALALLVKPDEFVEFLVTLSMDVFHFCQFRTFLELHSTPAPNLTNKTHSAVYNFMIYKHVLYRARKDFKQYPKVAKIEKKTDPDPEEAIDDDDKLDHTTNYSHLCMNVYERLVSPLRQSLKDFLSATVKSKKPDVNQVILEIIIQIAHEFALHCDAINAYSAWLLASSIASELKLFDRFVYSATQMINCGEDKEVTKLIKKAEKILQQESIDNYTRFAFYTELAVFYLKHQRLEEFRAAYRASHELYCELGCTLYRDNKEERNFERDFATAHFTLLIGAMEMLPCRDVVDEIHGSRTFQMPMLAFDMLIKYMREVPAEKRTQLYNLFFHLGEHIVWTHYWSGMLQDAMMYAKALAVHAEHTIATFRVCRLLVHMGKIKARAMDLDVCQVISADLDAILKQPEDATVKPEALDRDGVRLRDTSPTVLRQFAMPAFMVHANCDCTPCTSPEYQTALIEKFHLEAVIAESYNDTKTSSKLLHGCFKLYKKLECMQVYTTDTYAELLWTNLKMFRARRDTHGFDMNMGVLCELFQQRRCRNLYLSNQVYLMRCRVIVEAMQASKMAKCKTPECVRSEQQRSPMIKTPEFPRKFAGNIDVAKSGSNKFLEVPDTIGTRTRIRAKKNLYDDFQDSKSSEESSASSKASSKSVKKATRTNSRKPMR